LLASALHSLEIKIFLVQNNSSEMIFYFPPHNFRDQFPDASASVELCILGFGSLFCRTRHS
jgi:hypothetical protein